MNRSHTHLFIAGLLLSLSSCVINPDNGELFGNPSASFTVEGLGTAASAQIVVEARNQATEEEEDEWEQIATGTTAATAIVTPDDFLPSTNTPYLYYYRIRDVQISRSDDPSTFCRWDPDCTFPPGSVGATIRVRQIKDGNSITLFGGEEDSLTCHVNRLRDGDNFYSSGYECGFDDPLITILALT